ncbi:hypothetical protein BC940DRAFT_322548 [Gongronella butleri]|nr:hypothetical protein BC940DRAFT_322548 [Gongronella butleri]
MGWFKANANFSAITVAIDRMSNTEEREWFYPLQHLMESMAMQVHGAKEAIQVIEKRLKHGTAEQQMNLLLILKYMIDNSNHRILHEIVTTSKLKSRFKWMMKAKIATAVKMKLIGLLKSWIQRYSAVEPKIHKFTSVIELGYRRMNQLPDMKYGLTSRTPASPFVTRETRRYRRLSDLSLHSSTSTSLSPTGTAVEEEPLAITLPGWSPYARRQIQASNRHSYVF